MQIQVGETKTKYQGQHVKTATVMIPGRGKIELALSDTARCARMAEAARRTVVNLAGGEDAFDGEDDIAAAGNTLHQHCRRLQGIKDEPK